MTKKSVPKDKGATKKARSRKGRRAERSRGGCQDVQNTRLDSGFYLSRVGIKGVKKPIHVNRPKGVVTLTPVIDIYVDLPARQKGSHMSRNAEVLNELVDVSVRKPCKSLEALCSDIAKDLLRKHKYANNAQVRMEADYFREKTYHDRKSLESYRIMADAKAVRGALGGVEVHRTIGVEVIGMTACPCAMDTVRSILEDEKMVKVPNEVPTISHNQRNVASLRIQVPDMIDIEAEDLIDMVEASFSAPTFGLLKRVGEGRLVMDAHINPKFVEDVVRDILRALVVRYEELPDDVDVFVSSEAEESIHKHNAYAERTTTLGDLRRQP